MRKLIRAGIAMAAAAVMLSACGKANDKGTEAQETATAGQETPAATKSQEELSDEAEITLGEYKGLKLTKVRTGVSDNEVDNKLNNVVSANPERETVTDRPAQNGDTANIDYVGKKDGVAFSGGTANGYDLKLGSGQFIEGFEEGVVGMKIGEEKDINLSFPDPYPNNPDLAGQPVVFHVKLNSLNVITPAELNDAFAKRYLEDENATVDALRSKVYGDLVKTKERDTFYELANQALTLVINSSQIKCDPDAVDQMYGQLQQTYTYYAGGYGMELDDFLSLMMGTDLAGLKTMAEDLVKQQMVLDEIAAVEKVEATEEQKRALAEASNYPDVDTFVAVYGEESAHNLFTMEATYHFLIDNAEVTEVDETSEPETASADGAEQTSAAASADGADTAAAEMSDTAVQSGTTAAGTVEMSTSAEAGEKR